MDNGSICLLPWDSVAIRAGGRAEPCCRFWPSKDFLDGSSISLDFRNSKPWQELQEKMLSGEKDSACRQCYNQEETGGTSTRMFSIKGTDLPTNTDLRPIKMLDIAFSNLCNLACVSCSRHYSTTWGTEDFKAGRLSKDIKVLIDHPNSIVDNLDLSQLTILKIFGGEPFMDQDKFISLIKKVNLSKLKLLVSTNGTVLPNDELKSLMDQCNEICLDVSLDGFDTVNDWYRWPSKFFEVRKIMDQYNEWWGNNKNVKLVVHSVISIYSIWTLDKFVQFMTDNYPQWEMEFDWVSGKEWQSISVIPTFYKNELINQLTEWKIGIKGNWNPDKGNPFERSLFEIERANNSNIAEFQKKSLNLAKERKLDLLKMVPNIAKLFENSVDSKLN
jgi:sulfatase maturation enzyme AslB (radical SAM superfamily)